MRNEYNGSAFSLFGNLDLVSVRKDNRQGMWVVTAVVGMTLIPISCEYNMLMFKMIFSLSFYVRINIFLTFTTFETKSLEY